MRSARMFAAVVGASAIVVVGALPGAGGDKPMVQLHPDDVEPLDAAAGRDRDA